MAVSIRRMIKSFLEGFDAAGRLLLFFCEARTGPPMRLPPRGRAQIVQIWQAVPELNNQGLRAYCPRGTLIPGSCGAAAPLRSASTFHLNLR